jgi:RNA polymerase sigma-70 factor (ECF subfamily)
LLFRFDNRGGGDAVAQGLSGFMSSDRTAHMRQREPIVELYDELRPSLFGYLICLGLTPQQADDTIQDAFVQLFRVLQSGGAVNNPRSWLFRVSHNISFNLQKRERRLVSASDPLPAARLAKVTAGLDPEQIYVNKERMQLLAAAIALLPQRQRECLHLRAAGLRYREIAEVVGTTTSAVADALKRAVVRLMDELYE